MTSFPAFSLLFVQKVILPMYKEKTLPMKSKKTVHGGLEI